MAGSRQNDKSNDGHSRMTQANWERLFAPRGGEAVRWGGVDAGLLKDAVAAVTEDGAALLFGRTSDGGALVIQVLNGLGKFKDYPTSVDEANERLHGLAMMLRGPKR